MNIMEIYKNKTDINTNVFLLSTGCVSLSPEKPLDLGSHFQDPAKKQR